MGISISATNIVDISGNVGYMVQNPDTSCVTRNVGIHVPTVRHNLTEMDDLEPKSVADMAGRWLLLSCVPRLESRIVSDLGRYGVQCFWPRQTVKVVSKNGRGERGLKSVRRPIFSGYISACIQNDMQETAIREWRTQGIGIGVRPILNQRKFVRELTMIEQVFAHCPDAKINASLRDGDHCRIIAGPLFGYEGILLDRETRPKFQVLVRFMSKADGSASVIEMEFDPEYLEKI